MEDGFDTPLTLGALAIGMVFGVVAQRSKFCMVAAMSNWVAMRDYRQVHAYVAALAVALLGTQWLDAMGWVDVGASSYRSGSLDWLGALSGGLIFGFGAVLAGGCAGRTLVRAAEGNLGSLLALMTFAVAGMVALFGVLEPVHAWLAGLTSLDLYTGDASVARLLGISAWWPVTAVGLTALMVITLAGRRTRSAGMVAAGVVIGLLVTAGWWLTGHLARDEFSSTAPMSLTFSGPLARAALYLMARTTTTGEFGIFLVGGVLLGATGAALAGRSFHWVPPASSQVGSFLLGGILMGTGAALAGGCNIGHGLSGLATLSVQSVIAAAAIAVGMRAAIWWLERRS